MGLMEKIFGDLNEKEVKKVSKIADKVMAYDEEMQALTDEQLREKTAEFTETCAGRRRNTRRHSCRKHLQYAVKEHGEAWE